MKIVIPARKTSTAWDAGPVRAVNPPKVGHLAAVLTGLFSRVKKRKAHLPG
jgi:hypothetical protein